MDPIHTETYVGHDRRLIGPRNDWTSLSAWAEAVKTVGIPGAIAIGLVYAGATQVPKIVTKLEVLVVEVQATRELVREHINQQERILRVTQRTCWLAAKDDEGRKSCYE